MYNIFDQIYVFLNFMEVWQTFPTPFTWNKYLLISCLQTSWYP